jgi:hypoxanthine phosphoribosyltransferase
VNDIATLEIKLYEGIGVRGRRPYLRQPLVGEVRGRRILLVDDISDTGMTLQLASEVLALYMPEEVKTATLYIKPWTSFVPDYYGGTTEKWVVFPWEKKEYERLTREA